MTKTGLVLKPYSYSLYMDYTIEKVVSGICVVYIV